MNDCVAPEAFLRGCAPRAMEMHHGITRAAMLHTATRVASLRGAEECLRPYTNDVEN